MNLWWGLGCIPASRCPKKRVQECGGHKRDAIGQEAVSEWLSKDQATDLSTAAIRRLVHMRQLTTFLRKCRAHGLKHKRNLAYLEVLAGVGVAEQFPVVRPGGLRTAFQAGAYMWTALLYCAATASAATAAGNFKSILPLEGAHSFPFETDQQELLRIMQMGGATGSPVCFPLAILPAAGQH